MTRKDRTEICMEKEKLSQERVTTIPIPCFQMKTRCKSHEGGNYHSLMTGVQNHASRFGTYSQSGVMKYPGYQLPEMYLGKFPVPTEFQNWKVNSEQKFARKQKDPRLAMQQIKETEIAKSIDDFITPRSILGRTDFPDYDELDAMMASALTTLFDKHNHFRKKASVEEQRAQNNDRFLRGRQIAFMIRDHFRSTGPEHLHGATPEDE